MSEALTDRQSPWAFALGCLAVTAGVVLHLPMVAMARSMHYHLAGMPMDTGMIVGMGLIVVGVLVAGYGLLPRNLAALRAAGEGIIVAAPEDAPLGRAHWLLLVTLTVALVIDVMKPASLGFTIPGMVGEYGVPRATVSLVPFSALTGTVVGSVLWGWIADVYGRKASILLSAVMFVGTAICGAMPSLAWNIAMCFMMGAAAGGMLPVTYALLAEMMPSRHRGWSLVLVGGLGALGGYFAASGISALLQPVFGWRVLWLVNLPTGLILILLGRFIPESAKFLVSRGRRLEAERILQRFGARVSTTPAPTIAAASAPPRVRGTLVALSLAALVWGLVNVGLLLWLPDALVRQGYSVATASALLAKSALIALPTVFLCAWLYSRWSTKWLLVALIAVTIAGLFWVLAFELGQVASPIPPVALLIVGTNGLIAILLPYAAESFSLRVRARATGWVAACTKAGGLVAQVLGIMALVPALSTVALGIIVPSLVALLLVASYGRETRGRDLREMDGAMLAA
jgi:putative MFS transporter